jgi:two-component system, chemotaxis family, sensor kinase CheA
VHDLARDLGKDVELTIEGADTELDKTVIDQLSDPLMHLIRNSMDHGIEPPEVRRAGGKRASASIHLSARHSGASVLIGVSDDGAGIDAESGAASAIEKGLVAADAELTEPEILALHLSARLLNGQAGDRCLRTRRGHGRGQAKRREPAGNDRRGQQTWQGTSVTLRLPLTLAIIDGLLVSVGDDYFVLPLANTLECIELTSADIEKANGKHVANVRGVIVPYIRLREHFNIRTLRPELEQIMVVETECGPYGFVVDQVLGDCQTVIKNLGRFYRHVQVVSGATILGNGTVALILDPERLVQDAMRLDRRAGRGSAPRGAHGNTPAREDLRRGSFANAVQKCAGADLRSSA